MDILRRYFELVSARGETYLWYFPDGSASSIQTSTSPEALPTDGWGSSAMLWAMIEGLAGVVDTGRGYDRLSLSPRWAAAGVDRAEVEVGYAASARGVRYQYRVRGQAVRFEVEADEAVVTAHVLLPAGVVVREVRRDGRPIPFEPARVESSVYADFAFTVNGRTCFELLQ